MDPEPLCVPSTRAVAVPAPVAFWSSQPSCPNHAPEGALNRCSVTFYQYHRFYILKTCQRQLTAARQSTSAKMGESLLCCQADQTSGSQQRCQLCLRATKNTVISGRCLDVLLWISFRMRIVVLLNCQWEHGSDRAHKKGDTRLIIPIAGKKMIPIRSLRRWLGMEQTRRGLEKNLELLILITTVSHKISQRFLYIILVHCLNSGSG